MSGRQTCQRLTPNMVFLRKTYNYSYKFLEGVGKGNFVEEFASIDIQRQYSWIMFLDREHFHITLVRLSGRPSPGTSQTFNHLPFPSPSASFNNKNKAATNFNRKYRSFHIEISWWRRGLSMTRKIVYLMILTLAVFWLKARDLWKSYCQNNERHTWSWFGLDHGRLFWFIHSISKTSLNTDKKT